MQKQLISRALAAGHPEILGPRSIHRPGDESSPGRSQVSLGAVRSKSYSAGAACGMRDVREKGYADADFLQRAVREFEWCGIASVRSRPGGGHRQCVPGRRLRQDIRRAGLLGGFAGRRQSLNVDQPHSLWRRSSGRGVRGPELWRPHRRRLSFRHRLCRYHALCCGAGPAVPHPRLQRDRPLRRQPRPELRRTRRHRRPRRDRQPLRSRARAGQHRRGDDAAGPARRAHDWVSDPSLVASFQGLPGASFVVSGARPATDYALVSAGSELRWRTGWSLAVKLDGESASHAQTYAGTGTLRSHW